MLFSVILTIAIFFQAYALLLSLKFTSQTGPRSVYLYISITMALFVGYSLIILFSTDYDIAPTVRKAQPLVVLIISMLTVIILKKVRPLVIANKDFENESRKKEQQLLQARNIANLCFWEWNIDTNRITCSEKLCTLLNFNKNRTIYIWDEFLEYIHPDDQIPFREKINTAIYDKTVFSFQHRIKTTEGNTLHVREYAEAIYDTQGRPEYMLGTLQDITEQISTTTHLAEVNERVKKQQAELSHATRMATLGEMASGIAHEINQPLSAILNYANGGKRRIIDGKIDTEVYFELLGQISQQAERAAEIIKRTRTFVRKEDINLNEIYISDLIDRVIELVCNTTNINANLFELNYEQHLPKLRIDAIQIEQVLTNLILNALEAMEYTNTHWQLIRISIKTEQRHTITVSISDTGPGFPAESLNKVQDPFYTSKAGGLGLGLSICKTIIENHGGELILENNEDTPGATATFTLPIDR
ncbi:MAG: ATP-binding protein [Gammaproteobacteria bacterium]|nr:ATP-binding protein [Gammaproteobacteria bacterium]